MVLSYFVGSTFISLVSLRSVGVQVECAGFKE